MALIDTIESKIGSFPSNKVSSNDKALLLDFCSKVRASATALANVTGGVMTYDPSATPEYSNAQYVTMPADDWDAIVASAQAAFDVLMK